ncbi:MAG: hypothetical protein PUD42_01730 [Clostridiales bacterium]|nr:hypothetical protein [Clostridiales bacterium]MDY2729986.1 hypothetical protein [Clostridium sp.]
MKIPNKKNKIVIEYNNNKLIFTNTLYNKTIEIKDINSMYIFNDTIYILYKNNKFYKKSLRKIKSSHKEELKKFVEANQKESYIFFNDKFMLIYTLLYSIVIFYFLISDLNLYIKILLCTLEILFIIIRSYNYIHCNLIYDFSQKTFIKKNFHQKSKKQIPTEKIQSIKSKNNPDIMYIKLKQKYTKIILPQYVSAPSNISVALNELYLNNTIKNQ